jgi:hypothetical protein
MDSLQRVSGSAYFQRTAADALIAEPARGGWVQISLYERARLARSDATLTGIEERYTPGNEFENSVYTAAYASGIHES